MSQDNNNRIYDKIDSIDEKIDRKFDKLDKRLDNVEKELIVYNGELKVHIEGTNQIKHQNSMLKKYIDIETKKLRDDFKPIKKYVEKNNSIQQGFKFIVNSLLKTAGAVGLILGAYAKYKGMF